MEWQREQNDMGNGGEMERGGIDMQRNGSVADKVNPRGIDIHPPPPALVLTGRR